MRELILVGLGFVLAGLLSVWVGSRYRRLRDRDAEAFIIISVYGFRAALDTLILLLAWALISGGMELPARVPLAGAQLPVGMLLAPVFSLLFFVDFRVRLRFKLL